MIKRDEIRVILQGKGDVRECQLHAIYEKKYNSSNLIRSDNSFPSNHKLVSLWLELCKFLFIVADLSWSAKIEISHHWLFLLISIWLGHDSLISWVWLIVVVIIVLFKGRLNLFSFFSLPPRAFYLFCLLLWLLLIWNRWRKATIFSVVIFFSTIKTFLLWLWLCNFFWLLFLASRTRSAMAPTGYLVKFATLVDVTIC